ncbi:MAG: hypothetical protein WA935_12085, partial [Sphingopyxis granuli]
EVETPIGLALHRLGVSTSLDTNGLRWAPFSGGRIRILKQVGEDPFPARNNRSPAKAGVHARQRCAIWAPVFAGEQTLSA